jgi:hypothetical protein
MSPLQKVKIKIYKNVILPVVLCRCEAWTLKLRGKYRFRVFVNMVAKERI